jgi:hypothetical protein
MEGSQKPSRMTRRTFIALSGSAAAVTVVAVRSPNAPAQTAPAAAPTKGVELKFAMVAGYKADGTRSILPKFEQASGINLYMTLATLFIAQAMNVQLSCVSSAHSN